MEGTDNYEFTIAATGTLTLRVTEDGTASGTPIVGAVFNRTDAGGTVYGDAITTGVDGTAVFNNVPFGTGAPAVYYKQTASDGTHEFDDTVQSTTLTSQTETTDIINTAAASRTVTLTDANYENLPVDGTLNLTDTSV